MSKWILLVFVGGIVIASPTLSYRTSNGRGRADAVDQAKAGVAQVENEWLKSIADRDADTMATILADDFQRPDPHSGQFVTKADVLSYFRSLREPHASAHREIQNQAISVYGSSAIARGTLLTKDANGHVVSRLLFTDVFVQRAGKWLAVSAQENEVTKQ